MMDIVEGMCYGECCELFKTDDSQTCTPETNNTIYVNKKNKEVELNNPEDSFYFSFNSFPMICSVIKGELA